MITLDFSGVSLRLKEQDGKPMVYDPVRHKWLVLTPEEHIRQYLLQLFIQQLGYPASLIAVEKKIMIGKMPKRYDVVVYDRQHRPWLLAECKQPEIPITDAVLHQLLRYHHSIPCSYWLLTNGHQTVCADARELNNIRWLEALPDY